MGTLLIYSPSCGELQLITILLSDRFAVATVMFTTTVLVSFQIKLVKHKPLSLALAFFVVMVLVVFSTLLCVASPSLPSTSAKETPGTLRSVVRGMKRSVYLSTRTEIPVSSQ